MVEIYISIGIVIILLLLGALYYDKYENYVPNNARYRYNDQAYFHVTSKDTGSVFGEMTQIYF